MFSLRGVGGVLSRLLPRGRGRRAPQPASSLSEAHSPEPEEDEPKMLRGYADKMLRPVRHYSDKGECR